LLRSSRRQSNFIGSPPYMKRAIRPPMKTLRTNGKTIKLPAELHLPSQTDEPFVARTNMDRAPKSTLFESGNYLSSLGVTSFIPPVSRLKTNARMITSDGIQGCDLNFSTCFCVVKSTSE